MKKSKGDSKSSKRQKVSDSDDDSDNDISGMGEEFENSEDSDDKNEDFKNKSQNLFAHITNPNLQKKIIFSPSPTGNEGNSTNAFLSNLKIIDSSGFGKSEAPMSPKFRRPSTDNSPHTVSKIAGVKGGSSLLDFKINIKEDSKQNLKKGETDQKYIEYNQSSRTDGNQSNFTFENNNIMAGSMKSPGSIINFPSAKVDTNSRKSEKAVGNLDFLNSPNYDKIGQNLIANKQA